MIGPNVSGISDSPACPSGLSADAVRAAIARVIASPDFDVPDRAKRFLAYVVEETVAGRGDRIKAYSIATEVFGRDSSFDAQADPVVRIEAGRVRRALEHYYLTSGRDDEIVTTMPKGGYIPVFETRRASVLSAQSSRAEPDRSDPDGTPEETSRQLPRWALPAFAALACLALLLAVALLFSIQEMRQLRSASIAGAFGARTPAVPRILVRPFEDLTKTPTSAIVAKGLTEEIIGRIAKFRELVVVAAPPESDARTSSPAEDAERYVLEGSVRLENGKARLMAKVVRDGSVVWANIYDDDLNVRAILEVQNDIASQVATAIARPYGVIFQADAARAERERPGRLGGLFLHPVVLHLPFELRSESWRIPCAPASRDRLHAFPTTLRPGRCCR